MKNSKNSKQKAISLFLFICVIMFLFNACALRTKTSFDYIPFYTNDKLDSVDIIIKVGKKEFHQRTHYDDNCRFIRFDTLENTMFPKLK